MRQTRPNRNNRPIKILHLVNDLGYGGAPHVLFHLAKNIDKNKFRTMVGLWGAYHGDEMIGDFKGLDVEVVDFQASSKFNLKSLYSIYRYLCTHSIDILHTHLFLMHVMGRIAGKLAQTPWIVSTHHNLLQANHPLTRSFEKITAPFTDITTAVSRAAQETYFRSSEPFSVESLHAGNKHFTIYNSVNTEEIEHATQNVNFEQTRGELDIKDEFVFACVGRLHPSKGHKFLLDAVDYLRKTHSSVCLLIVGDGPLQNELMEQARVKGLNKYIRFLGYRDDVYRVLAVCNAVVQPSIFEGFGLASAEAMACGLPVVSTNLPSIAEVVVHEKTGLLVPPGDALVLSKAMTSIVDNPDLAAEYGANGKQRVQDMFSTQVITRQYEALYQALSEMRR